MSAIIATKPYLLRAIYEWCTDNRYTPYIAVKVQGQVHVPMEFVRDGAIVLNISFDATKDLKMDNEAIFFKARFSGVEREVYVPVGAVAAIYAGENNQGMAFDVVAEPVAEPVVKRAADIAGEEKTPKAAASEKPVISLAVINPENSAPPDRKKPKEAKKKPGLTVIK